MLPSEVTVPPRDFCPPMGQTIHPIVQFVART
jgi:hypothetical protein